MTEHPVFLPLNQRERLLKYKCSNINTSWKYARDARCCCVAMYWCDY